MQIIARVFTIILTCLLTSYAIAQDVGYTLTNPRIEVDGTDTFHLVDVLSYSNTGFKLGSGQLYFNYDTLAFGANIFNNGSLETILPDGSILAHTVGQPPFEFSFYSDIIINDNTDSRFSYSWQHNFSNDCLENLNINYFGDRLLTLKIRYKSGYSHIDPSLCLEGSAQFIDQTFTACGPDPCNTSDCFNHPGVQIITDFYSCSECLIVYSTEDSGIGTLREAINCAMSGDTVRFAPNLKADSIRLTSMHLEIDKNIYVVAKAELEIVVNGSEVDRSFDILSASQVLLEGVRILEGIGLEGTAIRNQGDLTLRDLIIIFVEGSVVTSRVSNQGTLTIRGDVRVQATE